MAGTMEGTVVFGTYKTTETFNYTDPTNGQVKPLVSMKVLVAHGDGTVSLESLSVPPNYRAPELTSGRAYGFPCTPRVGRKDMKLRWTLRADFLPFPAPALQ